MGGGSSAGQSAVWLARGGALVTLLHRRADLRETMSDYLVRELEQYGVALRNRSEIASLTGTDGQLEGVTLKGGESLPVSFLFLFLGRSPAPNGSMMWSHATRTDSSSRGPQSAQATCSRPPFRASSRPETPARAQPSGVPPP